MKIAINISCYSMIFCKNNLLGLIIMSHNFGTVLSKRVFVIYENDANDFFLFSLWFVKVKTTLLKTF